MKIKLKIYIIKKDDNGNDSQDQEESQDDQINKDKKDRDIFNGIGQAPLSDRLMLANLAAQILLNTPSAKKS